MLWYYRMSLMLIIVWCLLAYIIYYVHWSFLRPHVSHKLYLLWLQGKGMARDAHSEVLGQGAHELSAQGLECCWSDHTDTSLAARLLWPGVWRAVCPFSQSRLPCSWLGTQGGEERCLPSVEQYTILIWNVQESWLQIYFIHRIQAGTCMANTYIIMIKCLNDSWEEAMPHIFSPVVCL